MLSETLLPFTSLFSSCPAPDLLSLPVQLGSVRRRPLLVRKSPLFAAGSSTMLRYRDGHKRSSSHECHDPPFLGTALAQPTPYNRRPHLPGAWPAEVPRIPTRRACRVGSRAR